MYLERVSSTYKISIIVPVYNVAKYLRKCIESILCQTIKEIEIILVDDGSTDGSSEICDFYAAQDNRIKIIHKNNEGLSCARNDGIEKASASYILFVDSDDWIEPQLCEITYRRAIDSNADLVLFTFSKIQQNRTMIKADPKLNLGPLSEEQALKFTVQFAPAVWLGLYRKDLFNDIRFPQWRYHEDIGTTYRLIHAANSIWFIDYALYNYRSGRQGSIISTPETRDHPDRKVMLERRIYDLCNWGYETLTWNDAMYLLIRYGCKDDGQMTLVNIINRINGYPPEYTIKRKLLLKLIRLSPTLFDAICIVCGRQRMR